MKLFAPLNNFKNATHPRGQVTQWFGENPELYARIGLAYHNGIDYVQPHGSPMYAIEDGTVLDVKDDPGGFGKHVRILSDRKEKGGARREWTYGHCSKILVSVNDKVFGGQHIANMGNTGFVVSGATPFWPINPYAGTHLHLGLRKLKVLTNGGWSYPGSHFNVSVLNGNNGTRGAVDPKELMDLVEEAPKQKMWAQLITIQSIINSIRKQLGI